MEKILCRLACAVFIACIGAGGMGSAYAADQPQAANASQPKPMPPCKEAKPGGPEDVVRKVYADYPFSGPDVAIEPRQKLEKYFDKKLTLLLVKNRECEKRTHEMCAIDSTILYAAQGGEIADIHVCAMEMPNSTVTVQFRINGDPQAVTHKLVHRKSGWKIADIVDVNNVHETLAGLLERELSERGVLHRAK